ncbi:sialate O-acetylesterase [Parabacteroides sp. Marseille-P3160]|uniref:sialate O-acetylesterase n=1 Tax=Parabacteroides sp. Marseille-P3160 TaxID=1917887 RepID=UPI0009BAF6DD|nr:sialate O-acetylesterase [Parabacteroides sp. Marseille-P3160]
MAKIVFHILILTHCCFIPLKAAIVLPSLFSDNMVLQQNTDVRFWGNAEAEELITIHMGWNKESYQTVAGQDGKWNCFIGTPQAGGPYEIVLEGKNKIVIQNVYIGEVWICSGQSNMQMPLSGFTNQPVENSLSAILEAAQYPHIHVFDVAKVASDIPLKDCEASWTPSSASAVAAFSAVAYFFARSLHQSLQVPVGIITSNWGSSTIEAWMPEEVYNGLNGIDKAVLNQYKTNERKKQAGLYNGMIAPIEGYTAKGFVWYQGESNRHNYYDYQVLLTALVKSWRTKWEDENMPFYSIQLCPYAHEGVDKRSLPLTVEAQYACLKTIPRYYMVPTTDLGSPTQIHPPKKQEVGERLALLVMGETYDAKMLSGKLPTLKETVFTKNEAILYFNCKKHIIYPPDLYSFDCSEPDIYGFEIAGVDSVFYPANAIIDAKDGTIRVSSPIVRQPKIVHYAFRNYIKANLKTTIGLPIPPFRTN